VNRLTSQDKVRHDQYSRRAKAVEHLVRLVTWDDLAAERPDLVMACDPTSLREPLSVLGRDGEDPGAEVLVLPDAIIGPMGIVFDDRLLADDVHYLPPDWVDQPWASYENVGGDCFRFTGDVEVAIEGSALFVDSFGGRGNFSHFVRETLPYGLLQADLAARGVDVPALLPEWRFRSQRDLASHFFGSTVSKTDAWTRVERLLVARRRWIIDDNPRLPVHYRVPRRELRRLASAWPQIARAREERPTGAPVYLWRQWGEFVPGVRLEDRSLANGRDIDQMLDDRGFWRIDPLFTPVREVIRAVAQAPIVIGLHGAQMAHILWANQHATHVELVAGSGVNEFHRVLADALDLPTVRVGGQADDDTGMTVVQIEKLAVTIDRLVAAAAEDDDSVRWSLAEHDDPVELPAWLAHTGTVEDALLVARQDESVGEFIERVRWHSRMPFDDLRTVLADLLSEGNRPDVGGRVAVAGLAVDLRADDHYDQALRLLDGDESNEWARLVRARIVRLRDGYLAASGLVTAEMAGLADLPDDLPVRWLALAAKSGRVPLSDAARALAGTPALELRAPELDLGAELSGERRDQFVSLIAKQPRRDPESARLCVDFLVERMTDRGVFRSQAVPWIDYDTFDVEQVTAVVDAALAAADRGIGFSCVRLGDGEGLALGGQRANVGGALGSNGKGDWNELAPDDYAEFRRWLGTSLRNADFVGVPDLVQCLVGPDGCVDVVLGCIEHGVPAEVVVAGGWDISWALEVSGEGDRLVSRCTGVIGPVDPARLRHPLLPREIDWISIPGELHMYGPTPLEDSHWARSREVIEHDFRPGQLWLVGAGMLGKIYCSAIKAAGAVAVDVGSLMDLWSGRQDTRGTLRYEPWLLAPYVESGRGSDPSLLPPT
jgi:hypothetical protein